MTWQICLEVALLVFVFFRRSFSSSSNRRSFTEGHKLTKTTEFLGRFSKGASRKAWILSQPEQERWVIPSWSKTGREITEITEPYPSGICYQTKLSRHYVRVISFNWCFVLWIRIKTSDSAIAVFTVLKIIRRYRLEGWTKYMRWKKRWNT